MKVLQVEMISLCDYKDFQNKLNNFLLDCAKNPDKHIKNISYTECGNNWTAYVEYYTIVD